MGIREPGSKGGRFNQIFNNENIPVGLDANEFNFTTFSGSRSSSSPFFTSIIFFKVSSSIRRPELRIMSVAIFKASSFFAAENLSKSSSSFGYKTQSQHDLKSGKEDEQIHTFFAFA